MPSAKDVTPGRWSHIRILFDNGSYSVIAGEYDGEFCLGERWNGDKGSLGFPNVFGEPVWHVVPDFLAVHVLHGLLQQLSHDSPTSSKHISATMGVLRELTAPQKA